MSVATINFSYVYGRGFSWLSPLAQIVNGFRSHHKCKALLSLLEIAFVSQMRAQFTLQTNVSVVLNSIGWLVHLFYSGNHLEQSL